MKGLASVIFRLTESRIRTPSGRLEKPAVADFRLANGDPESEVVGYALGDRDIHLARRFQCGKDIGTMSASVPKMPEALHVELSDWCAGRASGDAMRNTRPHCNSAVRQKVPFPPEKNE
jgi:hypothetical protein